MSSAARRQPADPWEQTEGFAVTKRAGIIDGEARNNFSKTNRPGIKFYSLKQRSLMKGLMGGIFRQLDATEVSGGGRAWP